MTTAWPTTGRSCAPRPTGESRVRRSLSTAPNSTQAVATPDVRTGLVEDVYVSLAGGGAEEIVLDVFVFPMMWLLWGGGMVVVAGGVWSVAARKPERGVMSEARVAVRDG